MKPSQTAALLCKNADFRLWLDRRRAHKHQVAIADGTHTEQDARDFILQACAIQSRAELDANPTAARMFLRIWSAFNRYQAHHR